MKRVKTSDIKLGMRFSSPVFFDDGINMFLAERKPITTFHLSAIENWKIPYVITYGKIISNEDNLQTDEILEFLANYKTSLVLSVDGNEKLTNYLRPVIASPYHTGYYKKLKER